MPYLGHVLKTRQIIVNSQNQETIAYNCCSLSIIKSRALMPKIIKPPKPKRTPKPRYLSPLEQFREDLKFKLYLEFDSIQIVVERPSANECPADPIVSYGSAKSDLTKFAKKAGFHRIPETRGELEAMVNFFSKVQELASIGAHPEDRRAVRNFRTGLFEIYYPDDVEAFSLYYDSDFEDYRRYLKLSDTLTRIGKIFIEFEPNYELHNPFLNQDL